MTKYRKENRDKVSMSDTVIIRYGGLYNDMQNKNADKCKEAIAKKLFNHFIRMYLIL